MKITKQILGVLAFAGLVAFTGCKNDDGPDSLTLVSVSATGTSLSDGAAVTSDLNGTTSAVDVPINSVITAEFSRSIDEGTVSNSTVVLTAGANVITYAVEVADNIVTLTPTGDLIRGTNFTLAVTSSLAASNGGATVPVSRNFTTEGRAPAVVPEEDNLVVYLSFNGEVEDEQGKTILNDDVSFAEDRFGALMSAADFNGTTNFVGVEYSADMSNANTTVSYWMKLPASQGYKDHIGTTSTSITQFVTFCIGGNNGTYHEFNRFTCCELGYDIDVLKYFTNHVNAGSASNLAGSHIEMKNEGHPGGDRVIEVDNPTWVEGQTGQWVHIATTWDASLHRKAFFINGVPSTVYELTPSAEYSLGAATIDTEGIDLDPTNSRNLLIGTGLPYWATLEGSTITPYRGGKAFAFKGQMDDFRMFSVALTDAQVLELYNAEKP